MPTAIMQVVRGERNSHLRKAHGALKRNLIPKVKGGREERKHTLLDLAISMAD